MTKLIVIGLDGATWRIIDPLIKEGKMSFFKSLLKNGVRGNLKSCIPFITTPAWKCLSTGLNPGKLGVFHWFSFDKIKKCMKINTATSFSGKDYWDYLGEAGFTAGVINMPQTWPPPKINGLIVSGMHALDWSDYTYPISLKNHLIEKYNYKIYPDHYYLDERVIPEICELIKTRFAVAREFIVEKKVDTLNLTIYSTDTIQHYYWKYMNEGKQSRGAIETIWKLVDEEISQLIQLVDEDSNIIIVSDHGMDALKGTFHGNNLLLENGYLRLMPNSIDEGIGYLNKFLKFGTILGISIERLGWKLLKIGKIFKAILSEEKVAETYVGRPVLTSELEIGIKGFIQNIDWGKTKAIIIGEGLVYILSPINTKEYNKVRDELICLFSNIIDPKTENRIMDVVSSEDIYNGNNMSMAPDLLLIPHEGYLINDRVSIYGDLWNFGNSEWSAFHDVNGIFIGKGPAFKSNYNIGAINIYDIAPTIMALFNLPVPDNMDGVILENAFKNQSEGYPT